MVELSEADLRRLEEGFNRLRADVYVTQAIIGAMMANVLEKRGQTAEFFETMRVQVLTGLARTLDRDQAPENMREMNRAAANDFFDRMAAQLDILTPSEGQFGPS